MVACVGVSAARRASGCGSHWPGVSFKEVHARNFCASQSCCSAGAHFDCSGIVSLKILRRPDRLLAAGRKQPLSAAVTSSHFGTTRPQVAGFQDAAQTPLNHQGDNQPRAAPLEV
jgi:hypothetical protein